MSIESIRLATSPTCKSFVVFSPSQETTAYRPSASGTHTVMWRNLLTHRNLQSFGFPFDIPSSIYSSSSLISRPSSVSPKNITSRVTPIGSCSVNKNLAPGSFRMLLMNRSLGISHMNLDDIYRKSCKKSYRSVAEAVSSFDLEESALAMDEVQHIFKEITSVGGCVNEEKKAMRGVDLLNGNEISFNQEVQREEEDNTFECHGPTGQNTVEGRMRSHEALRRRQVKIETEAWEQAAEEYRLLLQDMCSYKLVPNLPYMKLLFLGWFNPLREAISQDKQWHQEGKKKTSYGAYFEHLPADMIAVITMHKVMGLMMSKYNYGSVKVVSAACNIGDAIEQEARLHKFLDKTDRRRQNKSIDTIGDKSEAELKGQDKLRKRVKDLLKKQKLQAVNKIMKEHDDSTPWDQDIKAQVGSRLIELLLQTAYIQPSAGQFTDDPPNIRPAFVHTMRHVMRGNMKTARRCGTIECDPVIVKGLEKTAKHMLIPYMPMLVPPIKWLRYDKGGYLFLPSFAMRTHGSRQQREVLKSTPNKQLESVFEALNTLGNTKWRINKRVLHVVDQIWSSGGGLAELVDRNDVSLPEKPSDDDEAELKKWKWNAKSVRKANRENYAERCNIELKLSVAHKMKDEDAFYYPHNVDFRGRAYPIHPHLNHLGSDLCRGLLEFAEGRPLGKTGLNWLKIHLANLYAGGVEKLSLYDRRAFIEDHLDEIFDSADRPLEGERWWLSAEDPFQCLAVCIDLSKILRSPSHETSISHTPVHQDGSCNGLQHYAALGRDKLGAASVNLVAGEKPSDVYSGIASRVLEIIRADAEKDPTVHSDGLYARLLVNQVDRKLVKQTVMTSVYGVTYVGAQHQIKKRLKERCAINDDVKLFHASCYAAKVTLMALKEMFEAARSIMSWLGDCGKIIASENQTVQWTTPLGLPVVQPYRKLGKRSVRTSLQILTLNQETEKILVHRQKTAFPPNFVHSLDGSHMMMTAVACKKAGLNFAGVHDSYWTHACDVEVMSRILREKFVELHEKPILEQLLERFEQSFPTVSFPPLPERGDFNLHEVIKSPYFFN